MACCNFCTKTFSQLNSVKIEYIQTLFDRMYHINHLVACNRCEMEILMVYENYNNFSISKDRATNRCHICYSDTVYVFNVSAKHTHSEDSFLRKLQYCSGIKPKRNPLCVCYKCIFILDLWYQHKILYENNAKHLTPSRQPKLTLLRDYGQGTTSPRKSLFKPTDKTTQKLEKLQKSLLLTIKQFKNNSRNVNRQDNILQTLKPVSYHKLNLNPSIKRDYKMYSKVCCVNLTNGLIEDPSYFKELRVSLEQMNFSKGTKRQQAVKKVVGSKKRKSKPFKLEEKPMKRQPRVKKAPQPPPKKPPAKKRARKAPPKKIPQPEPVRVRTESMSSDRTEFEFDASQYVAVALGNTVISSNSRTPSPDMIEPMMLVRNLTADRVIDNDIITSDLTSSIDDRLDSNLIVPDITKQLIQRPPSRLESAQDNVMVTIHKPAETSEKQIETKLSDVHDISDDSNDTVMITHNTSAETKEMDQDPEVQSTVPDSPLQPSPQNGEYVFNIESDHASSQSGNASPSCEVNGTSLEKETDRAEMKEQDERLED